MDDAKDGIYSHQPLWGKWYIELPLGKGSFGSVYKITREEMGNKYCSAVKVITVPSEEQYKEAKASFGNDESTLGGYFEDIVKNIVNEINVLYSLGGNTNIIGYQDHEVIKRQDTASWDILIRMELVTSLTSYLETHRMNRGQVVKLGMDICNALELCSKKGIIHRDIKDENIFINEDGVFKLGDFGIAKELSKSSRAASMRGTPLYMAPEIFRGEKYDAVVDIYSLGIVMYKLLNHGRMPFMPPYPEPIRFKDSELALERRIAGEPLPLPDLAGKTLGNIVLKACAHKAQDRFIGAFEMQEALMQVLSRMSVAEREELVTLERKAKEANSNIQKTGTPDQNTVGLFAANAGLPRKEDVRTSSTSGAVDSAKMQTVSVEAEHLRNMQEAKPNEKNGIRMRMIALIMTIGLFAACFINLLMFALQGGSTAWVWLSFGLVLLAGIAVSGAAMVAQRPRRGLSVVVISAVLIVLLYGGGFYVI